MNQQRNRNKLELTWYGKDDPINVEPRILIENPELSNTQNDLNTENMLIHGDNLLALKALEKDFTGKIKACYIDPPYNINAATEHYDDLMPHSEWLTLMKSRLEIINSLLTDDGLLAVQIDDTNFPYLFLLISELFGTSNVKTICVKMSEPSGPKMAAINSNGSIAKLKEFIIIAKKNGIKNLKLEKVPKREWDSEYKTYIDDNVTDEELAFIKKVASNEERTSDDIKEVDNILKKFRYLSLDEAAKKNKQKFITEKWLFKNAHRIIQNTTLTGGTRKQVIEKRNSLQEIPSAFSFITPRNKLYFIKGDFNVATKRSRCQIIFADEHLEVHPGDLWTDIKTTGLDNEGIVEFKNGKKPERLVSRIIRMNTQPGDYVLDSFLGSGTTAAVAHKLGRKWIGIELGDQAYTHCKVRLDAVINGTEKGGITKDVNWQGGGGYKFYELAPSLLEEDDFGELVISDEYDLPMLEEAVALHEGYTYTPEASTFWKQSKGTENSFLFVTTEFIDEPFLSTISSEMSEGEFLTISTLAFDKKLVKKFKNIKLKKIPESIMNNYDYSVKDYNLNIVNPPDYNEEIDNEE